MIRVTMNIDDDNLKEVRGAFKKNDWEKIKLFVRFLQTFHDTTLKFSMSQYLTCYFFL